MAQTSERRRRRELRAAAQQHNIEDVSVLPAPKLGAAFFARQTWLLLRKDLVTEFRTRETLITIVFFSLLLVVIFTFSLSGDEEVARQVTSGVIWIAVSFAGTLAIDRSFAQEQEGNTLTALVLIPGVARSLFVAKTVLNVFYLTLVQCITVPLVMLILSTTVSLDAVLCLFLGLLFGTIGFSAVGTVFSAMLVTVRRRGVLLPLILYPITIPLIIMGVEATGALIEEQPLVVSWQWVKMMGAVDVIYLMGGGWLFGHVMEEE